MATVTGERLLHDEARIARLEDWTSVVRARARDLARVGLDAVLLLVLWGVVVLLAAQLDRRS